MKLLNLYHLFHSLLEFQYLLGPLELTHIVTCWLYFNYHLVCFPPNMLVYINTSLLHHLNLHLDLHSNNFSFLYSLFLPDILHCNFRFNFHVPLLQTSKYPPEPPSFISAGCEKYTARCQRRKGYINNTRSCMASLLAVTISMGWHILYDNPFHP